LELHSIQIKDITTIADALTIQDHVVRLVAIGIGDLGNAFHGGITKIIVIMIEGEKETKEMVEEKEIGEEKEMGEENEFLND